MNRDIARLGAEPSIEIPTAINMKFVITSRDAAGQEVRTSFPCENKVTLVNQQ